MAQNQSMSRGREGDCAVRVFFDQDADRHCLGVTIRGWRVEGDLGMSEAVVVVDKQTWWLEEC
jgi:hypothetical protein